MAFQDAYRRQVALLIRTIPFVAQEDIFALKGGTAINLFVRDMPRLSVDIDLTYLPVTDRAASLTAIDAALLQIKHRVERAMPGATVTPSRSFAENIATKLIVRSEDVQIKIEVTPVLRGTVYEPVVTSIMPAVEDAFGFAEMRIVSFADLYAGKIVAALDRQHPRDLFDVNDLMANEGIGEELRRAFIVYLISHNRPIAELLSPTRQPLAGEFERGFVGMTREPVQLAVLEAAREEIVSRMVTEMPGEHRQFLIGFKLGDPDWELLGVPQAQYLPAVIWKQQNLNQLGAEKRKKLVRNLEKTWL